MRFEYCCFLFAGAPGGSRYQLRVKCTDLCLRWTLYLNDREIASFLDEQTNVLLDGDMDKALSYKNVNKVFCEMLSVATYG